MTELCTADVTWCGRRLVVGIPKDFIDEFPHGTRVAIVKVKTVIDIAEEMEA